MTTPTGAASRAALRIVQASGLSIPVLGHSIGDVIAKISTAPEAVADPDQGGQTNGEATAPPPEGYQITLTNRTGAGWLTVPPPFALSHGELVLLQDMATTPLDPQIEALTRWLETTNGR